MPRTRATYTCLTSSGKRVTIEATTDASIEEIKSMAAAAHQTLITDVVSERSPYGNSWADDDGDDDEEDETAGVS